MCKWNLDITLKSGVVVKCEHSGPEKDTYEVMKKYFQGKQPYNWVPLYSHGETHSTFVVVGEIASIDIYPRKETPT